MGWLGSKIEDAWHRKQHEEQKKLYGCSGSAAKRHDAIDGWAKAPECEAASVTASTAAGAVVYHHGGGGMVHTNKTGTWVLPSVPSVGMFAFGEEIVKTEYDYSRDWQWCELETGRIAVFDPVRGHWVETPRPIPTPAPTPPPPNPTPARLKEAAERAEQSDMFVRIEIETAGVVVLAKSGDDYEARLAPWDDMEMAAVNPLLELIEKVERELAAKTVMDRAKRMVA